MTLVADVHVSGPDLLLSGAIDAVPEATFSVVFQGGTDVLYVAVEGGSRDAVVEAVEADPTVTDVAVTAESHRRRILRVRLAMAGPGLSSVLAEMGVRVVRNRTDGHGWQLRLELPDREVLADLRSHCEAKGADFRLERLYRSEEPASPDEFGLTAEQRATLRTALSEGYFEVPRRASQRDLAAALGVSESAVSQRLRRAVGTLVENTVGGGSGGDGEGSGRS